MSSIHTVIDGVEVAVPLQLIAKYDQPLPRYTSYPTAPVWSDGVGPHHYRRALLACREQLSRRSTGISAYIHLPFCAERCTFCACNVVISKRRDVIAPYLTALEREIELVAEQLGPVPSNQRRRRVEGEAPSALPMEGATRAPMIEQLHLGGGTPTYLEPSEMEQLISALRHAFPFAAGAEVSIEADPRWTDEAKLASLRALGFNRISFGVQDVAPNVQRAINRLQPVEMVAEQIAAARAHGFESINIDLVYGLPYQTLQSWQETLESVRALKPDRIALFSFAYVPWLHAHHRHIAAESLPPPVEKFRLFVEAIRWFGDLGYDFIGLDHFAKRGDELSAARRTRTLQRNFQGYTTRAGLDLVGFGVTAIGEIAGCYVQNDRKLASFERRIAAGEFATSRGWQQTSDDEMRRWIIGRLFCHSALFKNEFAAAWGIPFDEAFAELQSALVSCAADGLLENSAEALMITPLGRLFVRNIGSLFDRYLTNNVGTFSRAV